MVAASVILPQEQKNCTDLFLLKHLNVDLKIELFLLQWVWLYFLLKSTSSFLEFYTAETRLLFDVFFRGYIAEVEGKAHW